MALAIALLLVWLLGSVLTPFLIAGAFAYLFDPLVDRLERLGARRTLSVSVVFVLAIAILVVAAFLIVPAIKSQLATLIHNLPRYVDQIRRVIQPLVVDVWPGVADFDVHAAQQLLTKHWSSAGGAASALAGQLFSSGTALLAVLMNLLLTPVILFYLLRDWDRLVQWIGDQIPRPWLPTCQRLAREIDKKLGHFVRGQLLVMVILGCLYALGLWLSGLNLALVIGFGAGLVSFVPYLGVISGLLVASVAMLVQTGDPSALIWVAVVFAVGQILEQVVLQPLLLGEAIGLHPVWVIFAVLAGGQLFGFVGVLIALPVASAVSVLGRFGAERWRGSQLYNNVSE
ncbi:AI-2E family transporter [Salinisphaera orenii]|uniref:AI-2E family transporter n=1 Tax=Salinisphaera orenii TaxID=856731 RepID=UPI00296F4ADE